MAMTLGQFRTLTEPGLSNIWFNSWPPRPEEYSRIMNIRDMEKAKVEDAKMAGFGNLQSISEGQAVTYDEAIAPVTRTYDFTKFGLGYKITEEFKDFELYGQVENMERELMQSSQNHIETHAHEVFNNATNTTISAGFDGLSLANTSHTRLDGGPTQQNRPSTLADLSLTSLLDGVTRFEEWDNDRGHPIIAVPEALLIPPALRPTAIELLGSDMRPDTANNATNAVTRWDLDIIVSHYLTTDTFWALIGDSHDINWFWYKRPTTSSEVDFDTDTIKRKVKQGYARGHGEWIGYYQGQT